MVARGPIRLALAGLAALALASVGCDRYPGAGGVLFHQACGACHTLSGHNDRFHQGGDLLGFHSSHRQLLELAREMPVPHALTARELGTIVTYVRAVERSHAGP